MSKFIISPKSCAELVKRRQQVALNNDMKRSCSFGIWDVLFYSKKNTKSIEFRSFVDGFIGFIGTPYFLSDYTISECYHSFVEDEIGHLYNYIGGHFVLIIQKEDYLYIITDGIGSIDVFYNHTSLGIISNDVSSTLIDENISYDIELAEIESVYLNSGTSTVFKEVRKLIGGAEYIKLDADGISEVKHHGSSIGKRIAQFTNWTEFDYFVQVDKVFAAITKSSKVFGLNFTGGLDGRTILASLLNANVTTQFYYGQGNSQITNTQIRDLEIAKMIADDLNIAQEIMDWSTNEKDLTDLSISRKYFLLGTLARVYGGAEVFLQSLIDRNKKSTDILFLGGFSPGFSNKDFHENKYNSFDEIVHDCLSGPLKSVGFKYFKRIYKRFYRECKIYCLSHDLIDENNRLMFEGHIIRALLYIRAESEHLQLFNLFDKYVAPYNTSELLLPMLALDKEYKKERKLQLNFINNLRPDLLSYPLFSGLLERKITKDLKIEIKKEHKKGIKIPIRYLAYRYYIFKNPTPRKYEGKDKELYNRITQKLSRKYRKRWFGFEIYNLRYCFRLNFNYEIQQNQKSLIQLIHH
jgi:hypothetical protein